MRDVSPQHIKALREKTGAGFLDCKKALIESAGQVEEAVDWLRKKGLSAASKKTDRVTSEGLVGVVTKGTWGAVLEVNAETDFVARNETFQSFLKDLLSCVSEKRLSSLEALKEASLPSGRSVSEELSIRIATIGESLNIRRLETLEVPKGVVASYVHGALASNMGRIGVLVALESNADEKALTDLGRKIAMHVAATRPLFLNRDDVDPLCLERERKIFVDQARESGRPDNVVEKMVEGRLRKYCEDVVLEEQTFVVDGKTRISDLLQQQEKELGHSVRLTGFARVALGEGVDEGKSAEQESDPS